MTNHEFKDWKRHPVTQQVFSQLQARIEQLNEELLMSATVLSKDEVVEKATAIKAYRDLLNIEYEES